MVNCLKKGSKKTFKCKTCSEINVRRTIYNGEPKLLKEISWHSRGKASTVSGDSRGYVGDRLPIGGPSLSDSSPLLRSSASHTWADGWSTLRLAGLCIFLYTTSEGGRQPCSAQYCSHRAMSSLLHSSSTTSNRSFRGRGSCRRPFCGGTVVGKAAWTFSNLAQFRSPFKYSQSLPTNQKHKYCLEKEICL